MQQPRMCLPLLLFGADDEGLESCGASARRTISEGFAESAKGIQGGGDVVFHLLGELSDLIAKGGFGRREGGSLGESCCDTVT